MIVVSPRSAGSVVSNSHFDNLLVRHELDEAAVVRVGMRGCLADPGRGVLLAAVGPARMRAVRKTDPIAVVSLTA